MTSTIKKLTAAFGAALISGAILASGAAAEEFHFSTVPTTVTGSQTTTLVFTTSGGTVSCKSVSLSGEVAAKTSTELAVTISTKECTAFGFANVTINWNGCSFKWTANGGAHIICPAGKPIEVTAPLCTYQIGGQSLPGGATFTTSGSPPNRHIIEHWNFSGLKYIECGTARSNGTWKGSTTTKTSSGEHWWQ